MSVLRDEQLRLSYVGLIGWMNCSSCNGETTISCAKYHIRIPTMIHGQKLFGPEISWLNHETATHPKKTQKMHTEEVGHVEMIGGKPLDNIIWAPGNTIFGRAWVSILSRPRGSNLGTHWGVLLSCICSWTPGVMKKYIETIKTHVMDIVLQFDHQSQL